MTQTKTYTLGRLASLLQVELQGDENCVIDGLATLQSAGPGKLSFLSNPAYSSQLAGTKASAVIVDAAMASACPGNKLISKLPYVTYAQASWLFDVREKVQSEVHASACVHESVRLAKNVSIGARAVIEAGAEIGEGSVIGPGCVIGSGCHVGRNCHLHANVTLYHRVTLGNNVEIHSGAVLGADGFGFAFDGSKSVKIAQLGAVVVGDDVEIGACTTIDRGALDDTVIEQGVKLDNQVQIGHNCTIGAHTVICGCTAIAGSTRIGKYCVLGGGSGVVGHIHIADRVRVSAMSLVSKSIDVVGTYSSGTGLMETLIWKRNIVRFRQLDEMAARLKKLERHSQEGSGKLTEDD